MVDPVGAKPVQAPDRRIAPVAHAPAAAPLAPVGGNDAAPVGGFARAAAGSAPVDTARVAALRTAILQGRYTLSPETVADRLIGAMHEWTAR